jgi:hypothetical protein
VISFFVDLIPAVHTRGHFSQETAMQMEANDEEAQRHEGSMEEIR